MASRKITVYATRDILYEVRELAGEIGFKAKFPPENVLNWYCDKVKLVEPAALGKQRSRDPKDDPYLACALAAGAKFIVTRDDDLLVLEKLLASRSFRRATCCCGYRNHSKFGSVYCAVLPSCIQTRERPPRLSRA